MPEQCVALSSQRPLLLIGFGAKAQHAGNVAEDLNKKAEPTIGKAIGICTQHAFVIAFYLKLCVLPEPVVAQRFR